MFKAGRGRHRRGQCSLHRCERPPPLQRVELKVPGRIGEMASGAQGEPPQLAKSQSDEGDRQGNAEKEANERSGRRGQERKRRLKKQRKLPSAGGKREPTDAAI